MFNRKRGRNVFLLGRALRKTGFKVQVKKKKKEI
jgi:hypothetical protein